MQKQNILNEVRVVHLMPRELEIQPAWDGYMDQCLALLRRVQLPVEGVVTHQDHFLVALDGGVVVGVIGAEVYRPVALLRSLAVDPAWQKQGIGAVLTESLLETLKEQNITEVYLLTQTAEKFFLDRGFVKWDRSQAPASIAATHEFRELCPQSAILMQRKTL